MIRFRTLLFLLSLTALTACASYSFFDPFSAGKPHVAVLDLNSDTNPYDDNFFTPDNSGLQSNRQKGAPDEVFPAFPALLSAEKNTLLFFVREAPPPLPRSRPFHYGKQILSVCLPVRAGPSAV